MILAIRRRNALQHRVVDEAASGGGQCNRLRRETTQRQDIVIILNKDSAANIEVKLDFDLVSGAVETEMLNAPALNRREAHITTVNEERFAQAGQVVRCCSPCEWIAPDGELSCEHVPFIGGSV